MARRLWLFLIALVLALVTLVPRVAHAGYTHYWTWHARPTPEALDASLAEMMLVLAARPDLVADRNGNTGAGAVFTYEIVADAGRRETAASPTSKAIFFNGIGRDAYEPFVFPGESNFNFTKTANQKYDVVVTACLLVARDHFATSVLEIASDGTWEGGDWAAGAALYTAVTKRPAQSPLAPFEDPAFEQGSGLSAEVLVRARPGTDEKMNWIISGVIFLLAIAVYVGSRRKRRWP